MNDRKQYDKLDEIGFIGTQKKVSPLKKKKMIQDTADIFDAYRKAAAADRIKKTS